jgi:alpha-amylase
VLPGAVQLRKKILYLSLVFLAVISGCGLFEERHDTYSRTFPWWNETVFYEIFVRSFYDSDGDGTGDFKGIIEKLDYLNDGNPDTDTDLGITGIWLMPIFPSPSYHGYDVTDYYSVNPEYGTLEDFNQLLEEAHQRGIRVVIDLVLNHTSDTHPWFIDSRSSPDSEFRDWYIWVNEKPDYKGPWGETVWHPYRGSYYYGIFESFMPDLNYLNPEVTAEMNNIVRFWLEEVGVDGFRLDAAKHLIEEGTRQENTPATHSWYESFRPVYKEINPNAMVVGEVYDSNAITIKAYTNEELDLIFNFSLATAFISSARDQTALPALGELNTAATKLPEMQYATFLTNHDQNRVMSQLGGNQNKAKVASSLLLTSPGVPFIYYGEELGMLGQKPDQAIRRPMQWSPEDGAGFTAGMPWQAPDSNYGFINVAVETEDPDSLLNHYRKLIQLRNQHPALSEGDYYLVKTHETHLYACLRATDKEKLLVVINTSNMELGEYRLAVDKGVLAPGSYQLTSLMEPDLEISLTVDERGELTLTPQLIFFPYTTLVFEFSQE